MTSPVARFGRLRIRGGRLLDAAGHTAQLRGMSLYWSQWQPQFWNPEVLRWLRDDWRIDVIRAPLGVHRDGYLAHPRREWRKIAAVIEAAIDLGIYVIADWHAHDPEVDAASRFFARLAREFGRVPNLLYEIWNEPDGRYQWERDIKPCHARVVESIRVHDAGNIVVAGTPHWSHRADIAAKDPLPFANVAYALHFYAGSNRQSLRDVAQAALARDVALVVTEWGTCCADARGSVDEAETRRWWDFLEQNAISHINWSVADKPETAAALEPGASPQGGWGPESLTSSGRLVRDQLRARSRQAQRRETLEE